MRNYNFKLAKRIIDTYNNLGVLSDASLGMQEDWGWTAQTVFEEGAYSVNLEEEDLRIAGINGSSWATPVVQLELSNGDTEIFECFDGEWTNEIEDRIQKSQIWTGGCLSQPIQISRMNLDVKTFKD